MTIKALKTNLFYIAPQKSKEMWLFQCTNSEVKGSSSCRNLPHCQVWRGSAPSLEPSRVDVTLWQVTATECQRGMCNGALCNWTLCLLSIGDDTAKKGFSLQWISSAKELRVNARDFSHYQNRTKLNNTGTSQRACLKSPTCIPPRRGVLLGWSDRDLLQSHSERNSLTLILHLLVIGLS